MASFLKAKEPCKQRLFCVGAIKALQLIAPPRFGTGAKIGHSINVAVIVFSLRLVSAMLHHLIDRLTARRLTVACLLWLVVFLIYLPAARAGFVADTTGWVQSIQRDPFWDYINRTHFAVKSMYQITQLNTWLLYQLLGHHAWGWHLVHVSLHALNGFLLFTFSHTLFRNARLQKPAHPALTGSLLFVVSPYASEVVAWEASFHYLQALVFIFSILILVQRFQERPDGRLAFIAGLLFLLSNFTLELFYLTPLLAFSLAFFYRTALNYKRTIFRKTLLYFTLPQVLIFIIHLLLFRLVYGGGVAHLGNLIYEKPITAYLVKAPWYFFHLIVWGRFFPAAMKTGVYHIFQTPAGAVLFYGMLAAVCLFMGMRYRRMKVGGKLISLFFTWSLLAIALLSPLFFPEYFWVMCDRYMYLLLAFYWMLAALLVYCIRPRLLRHSCILLCLGINLFFTLKLSTLWQQSETLIASIQQSPVLAKGKIKLLLNAPASLKGIPMIGTAPEGEFRLMHNLFFAPPIKDTMLEVAAYNMNSIHDGASATVINDHLIKVMLNQPEHQWWLGAATATSYENEWYRMRITPHASGYELTLKKPAGQYQLLYQTGNELKALDLTRKGLQH